MYGMNFSGGDNRTHDQIERAERIDSFEAGGMMGWRKLFSSGMVPLDCGHFLEDDGEIIELSKGQWSTTLELTRTPSGFGGSCAYRRYQEKYQRESMLEMLAILRPFK